MEGRTHPWKLSSELRAPVMLSTRPDTLMNVPVSELMFQVDLNSEIYLPPGLKPCTTTPGYGCNFF